MGTAQTEGQFEMTGGALCLDYTNTLGNRPRSTEEHLADYSDLLRFSRQAEALPAESLDELELLAGKHPQKAARAFRQAIEMREVLYRIFGGLACDRKPRLEDMELLNSKLHKTMHHLEIRARQSAFEWVWAGPVDAFDRLLWPVVRSAAELLTSEDATSIRECAAETCSWLFVDCSRTRRRRWCDMSTCGNRAKARRHYQRRKQSHGSE